MNKQQLKTLIQDVARLSGTEEGNRLKVEYDVYKQEADRKRSILLFYNAIILSIIAITNLVFVIIKALKCGE